MRNRQAAVPFALLTITLLVLAACGTSPGDPGGDEKGDKVLTISAIPDQDPDVLMRTYNTVSGYLEDTLDVEVRYSEVSDYTASVNLFRRGDLDLVFFGGVTGVQARDKVEGAVPLAQRDVDAEFRSVFIAKKSSGIEPVDDLKGLKALEGHSFTFGDKISTSGRVMPQHFMNEGGVSIDEFKGRPGYSGSHDQTAKAVESGGHDAGVLSSSVWDDRVKAGKIDTSKVREIYRTPAYHDYHWLAQPDLDGEFGEGFTQRLRSALLDIDGSDEREQRILELFQASRFIETKADNYNEIESVARSIGMLN